METFTIFLSILKKHLLEIVVLLEFIALLTYFYHRYFKPYVIRKNKETLKSTSQKTSDIKLFKQKLLARPD